MLELISALKDANIPSILVISGIILILLAIGVEGIIRLDPNRQKIAGFAGLFFMVVGIFLFFYPSIPPAAPLQSTESQQVLFFDNFDTRRNDGFRLSETSDISFTTSIEVGYYNVDITTGAPVKFIQIPNIVVSDFEYRVDFRSLEGNVFFATHFRSANDGQVYFDFFATGSRTGEYYISYENEKKAQGKIVIDKLEEIRILCKADECKFYVNNSSNPFAVLGNMPTQAGTIKMGFAGTGNFKIEEIEISEVK